MIQDLTEQEEKMVESMQKELHAYTEGIVVEGKAGYQDVVTIFFMMKIVQLQNRIKELEDSPDIIFPRLKN